MQPPQGKAMSHSQIVDYYSRPEVAEQLILASKDREVAGVFWDGKFDKRPNVLQYPTDITQMAKNGITSFHMSVERWQNPMLLLNDMQTYSALRRGWDFLLDFDSKIGIEGARIAALCVSRFLERYGIRNYGIKFSGSRGFHMVIPWEAFPKELNYKPLAQQYPDVPQALTTFIKSGIADELMGSMLKYKGAQELLGMIDAKPEHMSPFYFVEIEKWGLRHMFRAPFSLNEKTWLASVPISKAQLGHFDAEIAKPESISFGEKFIMPAEPDEAENLLIEAYDKVMKTAEKPIQRKTTYLRKVPEQLFPPCMKLMLSGMEDGRKRSLFTLINFLRFMNWAGDDIEMRIGEWNMKNSPPLPTSIVTGQLRYHQGRGIIPHNCREFYEQIVVCRPDETCKTIKNPLTYPFRKMPKAQKGTKFTKALYKCEVCDHGYDTMRSLNQHRSRMHGASPA